MKHKLCVDERDKYRISRTICLVYKIDALFNSIELYSLCYVKSKDEFALLEQVDLPGALINRYEGYACSALGKDKVIDEMEAIGIINVNTIKKLIDDFQKAKEYKTYLEYRNSIIKDPNKKISTNDLIKLIEQLRRELIAKGENTVKANYQKVLKR